MRQLHVVDGCAGRLEHRERLIHALGNFGIKALGVVLGNAADPHAGQRLIEQVGVPRHIDGQRGGVTRIVSGDRLHDQGAVGGAAGHRPDLVEARSEGDQATAADAAVGRLESGDAAEAGRLPDRAAGVGADSRGGHVGRHAGSRTAARTARGPRQVPRVTNRAEGRILVRAAHRELVHVGLAHEHRIGLTQPGDHIGVVGRPEALQHLRRAGSGHVGGAEHVLERHWQAGEGSQRLACFSSGVDVGGPHERSLTIDGQESVDRVVGGLDPVKKRRRALHGRDVALPQGGDQIDGRHFKRLHGCSCGGEGEGNDARDCGSR